MARGPRLGPIAEATRAPLLVMLAWRNLWRHKRRTAVMLFALALGIWSMVVMAALIRGSMEQHVKKEILNLTGHVQIHAPGYRDDPAVDYRFTPSAALMQALTQSRWLRPAHGCAFRR
jgi:ABC-type lipoprotein release transport system permease subunit